LHQKKYRNREGLFLAEGVKLVDELLNSSYEPYRIYSTDPDLHAGAQLITEATLKKISVLVQPNKSLGIFKIPSPEPLSFAGWILALDRVRDPGNLGTMIRLCDWFGIGQLLCSSDTVDCFNPKVLQATMGSIARVNIHYLPLAKALTQSKLPVFGASMEGSDVTAIDWPGEGILVMGSESHGISAEVRTLVSRTLSIPGYGGAESLNVATATAILLHEIRREGFIQR
jgi:TrmH family RNA methyltransferase